MLWVALAEAGLLGVTASLSAGLIRSLLHSQARERDLLLNQLLHATGRPWQPAPASLEAGPVSERDWVVSPEQQPLEV